MLYWIYYIVLQRLSYKKTGLPAHPFRHPLNHMFGKIRVVHFIFLAF
jgi:hypothetical protein